MRIASVIARYLAGLIFLVFWAERLPALHSSSPAGGALPDSSWAPFMSRITCG
jgi:hypothetical protein